jgi:hypothetical protein
MKKITCFLILMLLSISLFSQVKTGTLKIFSELTGITVYVDNIKQATDITAIVLPVGDYYLKVLYQETSVYGEIVKVTEGETTTVLIKNTGQVQEKVMETKTPEREEYQNSKVEVLLSSNAITSTTGKSSMYPGYYGYYGYSKSTSVTTNETDFKIIQGGVKEIGEINLATLAGNQDVLNRNAADNLRIQKTTSVGAIGFLGSMLIGVPLLIDQLHKSTPEKPGGFLHKKDPNHPKWEAGVLAGCIITGTISYVIVMGADKSRPKHYYTPDVANRDAQTYNKKLKNKLGLPESYDVK